MSASATPGLSQDTPGTEASHSTIVVGVDGSDSSWSAFWWACGEAKRLDGRILAVYVAAQTDPGFGVAAVTGADAGGYVRATEQLERDRVAQLTDRLSEATVQLGLRISFRHLRGDTAAQLIRTAREAGADMIAVGRSTKLSHRLMGSLGRRLTRDRQAPIVVIVP